METTNSPWASSHPGRHQSEWPADMTSESVADFAGIRRFALMKFHVDAPVTSTALPEGSRPRGTPDPA
jgi:hypothetical protein